MTARYWRNWIGTEGGYEHVILSTRRSPWGVYLSLRSPIVAGKYVRVRLCCGPAFGQRLRGTRVAFLVLHG